MPVDKLEIVKTFILVKPRKLNVKWTFELPEEEEVRKKPETREEEADEIIHRLSTQPKKNRAGFSHGLDLEKEIMDSLSKAIVEEVDKELLECLKK